MSEVNSFGINSSSGIGFSSIMPVLLILIVCGVIAFIVYKNFLE
jgi:hypothetical protein